MREWRPVPEHWKTLTTLELHQLLIRTDALYFAVTVFSACGVSGTSPPNP
jgi:hypothetical protein